MDPMVRSELKSSEIPKWKIPLSKSFTSSFYNTDSKIPISPVSEEDSGRISKENSESEQKRPSFDDQTIIQILLPCIICNRTFSPEALERHSKICTKVNVPERSSFRKKYDSHAMRIKNTKVADFIPPPPPPFTRSSSFRRSIEKSTNRTSRAASTPKTLKFSQFDDNFGTNSEFGSSEDSNENYNTSKPSYARGLSPSEDCPYCLRSFGVKAFERHFNFCKEVWERQQYEVQPTPKEIEEARERQEIRTKYRPIKNSTSCTSLRGTSPVPKREQSFASAALSKLFGFKKSNESLPAYKSGSLTRSFSFRNPSKIPTLNSSFNKNESFKLKNKSSELVNIPSSGYGPGGHYMSNFLRNSQNRTSLGRNFFKNNKRVEPEGLENSALQSSSPLIISPMNFYNRGNKGENYERKSSLFSSEAKYDPYEKAARQLEELLRAQPPPNLSSQKTKTQRKVGLDRALASVMGDKKEIRSYNELYRDCSKEADPFRHISADENYWDEILRAKNNQSDKNGQNEDLNKEVPSEDNSRGVSNISSADSAFSRSDESRNDLEFEALESLLINENDSGRVPENNSKNRKFIESENLKSRRLPLLFNEKTQKTERTPSSVPAQNYAKFCHECGASYPTPVAKFCPQCGERRVINV